MSSKHSHGRRTSIARVAEATGAPHARALRHREALESAAPTLPEASSSLLSLLPLGSQEPLFTVAFKSGSTVSYQQEQQRDSLLALLRTPEGASLPSRATTPATLAIELEERGKLHSLGLPLARSLRLVTAPALEELSSRSFLGLPLLRAADLLGVTVLACLEEGAPAPALPEGCLEVCLSGSGISVEAPFFRYEGRPRGYLSPREGAGRITLTELQALPEELSLPGESVQEAIAVLEACRPWTLLLGREGERARVLSPWAVEEGLLVIGRTGAGVTTVARSLLTQAAQVPALWEESVVLSCSGREASAQELESPLWTTASVRQPEALGEALEGLLEELEERESLLERSPAPAASLPWLPARPALVAPGETLPRARLVVVEGLSLHLLKLHSAGEAGEAVRLQQALHRLAAGGSRVGFLVVFAEPEAAARLLLEGSEGASVRPRSTLFVGPAGEETEMTLTGFSGFSKLLRLREGFLVEGDRCLVGPLLLPEASQELRTLEEASQG